MVLERSDEDIARTVQKGDREAFGLLVLRYQPKLARYARKFLFRGDDVTDLIQDVFVKAYTNIQGFDPKRRFSPWIYRIAHNTFVNAVRDSAKDRANFSLFDVDVLFPAPRCRREGGRSREADGNEAAARCFARLARTEVPRSALVLYYYRTWAIRRYPNSGDSDFHHRHPGEAGEGTFEKNGRESCSIKRTA